MSGETWRSTTFVGKESAGSPGTPVPRTRKMFVRDPRLDPTRAPRPQRYSTGSRDNVRAFTQGPLALAGQFVMPMSADEIIEVLLGGVSSSPGIVTSGGASTWTFTPSSNTPDSQSWEWFDGARAWEAAGVRFNTIRAAGNANAENLLTATVFATALAQTSNITGSPADRTPQLIEGWETKCYLDNFLGTPATTPISNYLVSWDVTINNNFGRKFLANNANTTASIVLGQLDVSGTVVVEASTSQALTEFNNWVALTKRLLVLEFGNNQVIAGSSPSANYKIQFIIPLAYAGNDIGSMNDAGTKVYSIPFQYVYDPTNAFGFQVKVVTGRTAAY